MMRMIRMIRIMMRMTQSARSHQMAGTRTVIVTLYKVIPGQSFSDS